MNALPNETEIPLCETDLIEKYSGKTAAIKRMFESINTLPSEDRTIVLRALRRYESEAQLERYGTDPRALVQFLADERLIEGSQFLVDLGAGPGDLLCELAPKYPDTQMVGVDLSPGFAEIFNRKTDFIPGDPGYRDSSLRINPLSYTSIKVGLIDAPFQDRDFNLNATPAASAVSVLTLDRLTNPRVLIKNMARFTQSKILGTLLPVVPEDDNPSRQGKDKMIYTRPQNRIVPGRNAIEDREKLLGILKDTWRSAVDVATVPYTVSSSGDRQDYDLAVFYART